MTAALLLCRVLTVVLPLGRVLTARAMPGKACKGGGQLGAGDTSLSRVPRQRYQQCQYPSSTLLLFSLSPWALKAVLGRACSRMVSEEQVILPPHV